MSASGIRFREAIIMADRDHNCVEVEDEAVNDTKGGHLPFAELPLFNGQVEADWR